MAGQKRVFALDVPAIRVCVSGVRAQTKPSERIATLDRRRPLTDHGVLGELGRIDEASSKGWSRCGSFECVIT